MTAPSSHPILEKAFETVHTDPGAALALCDQFAAENKENADLHFARVQAYNRLKNWPALVKSADAYVRLEPDEPMPYWRRAQGHYYLGDFAPAISDLETAVGLDDDSFLGSRPYRLLAMCQARLGNLDAALSSADKADQFEPQDWFPPVGPIPSGTIGQFKAYLTRLTESVS